ncbi:MAG: Type pilin PilA [Acidobacteriales bacterium]|nr:Type pilin PilA [Terriglobales bacterium]
MFPFAVVFAGLLLLFFLGADRFPKKDTNGFVAVGALRTINSAQISYQSTNKTRYACDLPSLHSANLIDSTLAGGVKSGYRLALACSRPNGYIATADPIIAENGNRKFCTNETGAIYSSVAGKRPCTDWSDPIP